MRQELKRLVGSNTISFSGGYYHLPGRSALVALRQKRALISTPLLHHARVLTARLAGISGVLAIYLTGSLAVKNPSQDSDVDLMIITRPGKLWTTRFFLTLYTTILGMRRTPGSKRNSGKLCLNLYLTPTSYQIPVSRRSLYTAYELVQAVPLYDPQNTHRELLVANSWLFSFLPNFSLPQSTPIHRFTDIPIYMKTLESLLYHLQYSYMKNKITREYITLDSAFFHPHDPGSKVLKSLNNYHL